MPQDGEFEYGRVISMSELQRQLNISYYQFDDMELCAILCQISKKHQQDESFDVALYYAKQDCKLSFKLNKISLSENGDQSQKYLIYGYHSSLLSFLVHTGGIQQITVDQIPFNLRSCPQSLRENFLLNYLHVQREYHYQNINNVFFSTQQLLQALYYNFNSAVYYDVVLIKQFFNVASFYLDLVRRNTNKIQIQKLSPKQTYVHIVYILDTLNQLHMLKFNRDLTNGLIATLHQSYVFEDCSSLYCDIEFYRMYLGLLIQSRYDQLKRDKIILLVRQNMHAQIRQLAQQIFCICRAEYEQLKQCVLQRGDRHIYHDIFQEIETDAHKQNQIIWQEHYALAGQTEFSPVLNCQSLNFAQIGRCRKYLSDQETPYAPTILLASDLCELVTKLDDPDDTQEELMDFIDQFIQSVDDEVALGLFALDSALEGRLTVLRDHIGYTPSRYHKLLKFDVGYDVTSFLLKNKLISMPRSDNGCAHNCGAGAEKHNITKPKYVYYQDFVAQNELNAKQLKEDRSSRGTIDDFITYDEGTDHKKNQTQELSTATPVQDNDSRGHVYQDTTEVRALGDTMCHEPTELVIVNQQINTDTLQQRLSGNTTVLHIAKCRIPLQECLMLVLSMHKVECATLSFLDCLQCSLLPDFVASTRALNVLNLSFNSFQLLRPLTVEMAESITIKHLVLLDVRYVTKLVVFLCSTYRHVYVNTLYMRRSECLNDLTMNEQINIERICVQIMKSEDALVVDCFRDCGIEICEGAY